MAPVASRLEAQPLPPLDTSDSNNNQQDGADKSETEMQQHWDELISKNMELPDGYSKVSVLIIKWEDSLDNLKVEAEVRDLTTLFEETFRYEVEVLELGAERPQLQLVSRVTDFAHRNGADENLLIVYYAGHGIFHTESKELELIPTNEDLPIGFTLSRVLWKKAERHFIDDVEADVLSIMDCCFSSNLVRNSSETGRTFEMLAASGVDQVTPEPGGNSFTRALIKCLEDLAHESSGGSFTTRDVFERIQKERPHTPPALWRRLPGSSRHIRLAPQKDMHEKNKAPVDYNRRGFLQLGFVLKQEKLGRDQIEELTRHIPKTFTACGAPVREIKWLGFRKIGHKSFKDVAEFLMKQRRNVEWTSVPIGQRKSPTSPLKRKQSGPIATPADSADEGRETSKRQRAESPDTIIPD